MSGQGHQQVNVIIRL